MSISVITSDHHVYEWPEASVIDEQVGESDYVSIGRLKDGGDPENSDDVEHIADIPKSARAIICRTIPITHYIDKHSNAS